MSDPTSPTEHDVSTETLLRAAPVEVYKADARSRVWRVDSDGKALVIKRFEYSPWQQRLVALIGRHPAQRERRAVQRLTADGLPVALIADHGFTEGRAWLAVTHRGASVQQLLLSQTVTDRARRNRIVANTVELALQLIERGWFLRDFQVANIVIDENDGACLIDTGDARPSRRDEHARRMLRHLATTARADGATWTDCLRGVKLVETKRPDLGTVREWMKKSHLSPIISSLANNKSSATPAKPCM